jgi:hypothetical protein
VSILSAKIRVTVDFPRMKRQRSHSHASYSEAVYIELYLAKRRHKLELEAIYQRADDVERLKSVWTMEEAEAELSRKCEVFTITVRPSDGEWSLVHLYAFLEQHAERPDIRNLTVCNRGSHLELHYYTREHSFVIRLTGARCVVPFACGWQSMPSLPHFHQPIGLSFDFGKSFKLTNDYPETSAPRQQLVEMVMLLTACGHSVSSGSVSRNHVLAYLCREARNWLLDRARLIPPLIRVIFAYVDDYSLYYG